MFSFCIFKTLPPWKKEYKDDIMKSWRNLWQIWPKFLITVVTTIQVTPPFTSVQKFLNHSLYRNWKDSRLAGEWACSVFWINSAPQALYTVLRNQPVQFMVNLSLKIKNLGGGEGIKTLCYNVKDKRTDSVMRNCQVCDLLQIQVMF